MGGASSQELDKYRVRIISLLSISLLPKYCHYHGITIIIYLFIFHILSSIQNL